MDILEQFLTLPMLAFCIVIGLLVEVQRRGFDLAFPKYKDAKLWRDFFLPLGPPGTGVILAALVSSYPFPEMLTGLSGRIFCGVVCGVLSSKVYRMAKTFLTSKIPTSTDSSDPPGSANPPDSTSV